MPCACSILLPSRLPQRRAPSNSSTPETEARGPHPTWPIKTSSPPPKPSALRSKAILHVRRTRMIPNRSLGSLGSSLVSADGIAITSHPVQRPFAEVGTSSKRWPLAMLLRWLNKMCESRSLGGPGRPDARGQRRLRGAPRLVAGGEPAHGRPGLLGAAPARIRQDRGEQRRLTGTQCPHRLVEGVAAPGLGAELAGGTPFGNVEIDFEHAPFGQDEVDPQRQRKLQRLAHEAASRPQEQVLGALLGDGRDATRLADVVDIVEPLADLLPVDAAVTAE